MEIYLVGGAVRDALLGIPVKERDWVVVGSNPEEMHDLGFKKVGKDFPVFFIQTPKKNMPWQGQKEKGVKGIRALFFMLTRM